MSLPAQRTAMRLIHCIFGTIGHVPIDSPEFERRIRTRYALDIAQLEELGFRYFCSYGETFSLFRLPLLLPALTLWGMWRDHEALTVRGTKTLAGYAVLLSHDGTTYANPNGLGIKLFTAFQDGTLVSTGNYHDPTARGPLVTRNFRAAPASEMWAEHQGQVRQREAEGRQVDRRVSFDAWVRISDLETAPW